MTIDARELLPLAEQAVSIAREFLTELPRTVTAKGDRDMVTEVDYAIEQAVRDFLAGETPEIGFLGEEEGITGNRNGLMWALDPIDGTANFTHGIPLFAISLGLIDNNRAILGVIDLPFLGSLYSAADGAGATCDGKPIHTSATDTLNAAIVSIGDYAVGPNAEHKNRLRIPLNHQLATRVQRVRMYGSAAIDLAWVAQGKSDACIMLSNNPWDTAAGITIAREAGAHILGIDGTPHSMTATATIATTPKIATELLAMINQTRTELGA
ncbi:inositol monophosphatase [Acrocarpospora pleiomorpha]|uniref:Inositol monophosphatase n=1 Tax=Acrocarpospora pleiomorpha TaxID=90975 RepID=A0A5M3XA77_9ACTN|nr:inositol monophosphatase family protein [Acrocarpospora pleiomorpha]GES18040.1 inositol monophosphatase [Acrocarpospora pleiomorpha]